jgi:hypothetical protein
MATGEHPQPAHWLRFLARKDTSADYIRRSAAWLRETYPASAPKLLPELRRLYRVATARDRE